MTDLYKKINELDAKYGYDFEGELYEHLKNKFPKEYKLTVEAKKKDEPDEDPETFAPGRMVEHMGDRVEEFYTEYEAIMKKLNGE